MKHTGSRSNNDSPRVGNVPPVKAYPWNSSRVLHHLVHLVSHQSYSQHQGYRYVRDIFMLCTLKNSPLDRTVILVQVLDLSICEHQNAVSFWLVLLQTIAQTTLGTLMCLLAIIRFIRESLQMYKVTKRFEISRYLSLLTRDGMAYFLAYVHVLSFHLFPFPCYQANNELLWTASCYIPSSIC